MAMVVVWQQSPDEGAVPGEREHIELVVFAEQFAASLPVEVPQEAPHEGAQEPMQPVQAEIPPPELPVKKAWANQLEDPSSKPSVKVAKKKPPPKPRQKPVPNRTVQKLPEPTPVATKVAPVAEPVAARAAAISPASRASDKGGATPRTAQKVTLRARYKAMLAAAIEKNKYYPNQARRRRIEGEVRVAFTILADGSLSEIRLTQSSGSKVLDNAALGAIRKLARVDPLPRSLEMDRWEMIVPLSYKLL
jgi:protein TonB